MLDYSDTSDCLGDRCQHALRLHPGGALCADARECLLWNDSASFLRSRNMRLWSSTMMIHS